MSIYNYEILNPVISPKRPFYDTKRKLLFFPVNGSNYRYYIEVARNNKDTFAREYYVLLAPNASSVLDFDKSVLIARCKSCGIPSFSN